MEKFVRLRWRLFKALFTRDPLVATRRVPWLTRYDRDQPPQPIAPESDTKPAADSARFTLDRQEADVGMDYRDVIAWWLFTAGETGFESLNPTGRHVPEGTPGPNDDVDDPIKLAHQLAHVIDMTLTKDALGWRLTPVTATVPPT
jgi:hypothetical protein